MMSHEKMNALLEKYWEAETSIEEERALKNYFAGDDIHPDHFPYRELFVFFDKEQNTGISMEQALSKVHQSLGSNTGGSTPGKILHLRRWGLSIAASIIMVFGAITIWENYSKASTKTYVSAEIENPDEALEITLEALAYLSGKMKKGTDPVKEQIEKVKEQDIFK